MAHESNWILAFLKFYCSSNLKRSCENCIDEIGSQSECTWKFVAIIHVHLIKDCCIAVLGMHSDLIIIVNNCFSKYLHDLCKISCHFYVHFQFRLKFCLTNHDTRLTLVAISFQNTMASHRVQSGWFYSPKDSNFPSWNIYKGKAASTLSLFLCCIVSLTFSCPCLINFYTNANAARFSGSLWSHRNRKTMI